MSLGNGVPTALFSSQTKRRHAEPTAQEGELAAGPGGQTLLPIPSMSTGLKNLPETAFENLLIVSPWAPQRIETELRELDVPIQHCGLIPLNGPSRGYDGPLWTSESVAPADLTGLSIRYCEAMSHVEPGTGWVVFDNVQVLFMYAETKRVVRLLRRLTEQATDRDVTGVLAVDRAAVEKETLAHLSSLTTAIGER